MKKHKKHQEIVGDYEGVKSKHLVKLANQILKGDKRNKQLKNKHLKNKFLDNF